MADIEQRFIYSLLTANKANQQEFRSKQVPRSVFTLHEREIGWVYKYREKHNCYPSVRLFHVTFPDCRLQRHNDPIKATLQPVLDMAMFGQMKGITDKAKDILDKTNDVSKAMETFRAGATSLSNYTTDYVDLNFEDSGVPFSEYKTRVKNMANGSNSLLTTPWPSITKLVKYFSPGDTIVFAARTSIGKTWCLMEWVDYYAKNKVKTLVVTKEMSTNSIAERAEAKRFKLDYDAMREGTLPAKVVARWRKDRIKAKAAPKGDYPLIISGDETIEGVGLSHVIAKIEQYKPQVVVIDGAYLLVPEGLSSKASTNEKYQQLSNRCKAIAKATGVVIILVLQLNRGAEKAGEAKGGLSNIFGSDTWAQDADAVFILQGQRGSNVRTLVLDKGRNSAIGEVTINFKLSPYPDLSETRSVGKSNAKQTVSFKGV